MLRSMTKWAESKLNQSFCGEVGVDGADKRGGKACGTQPVTTTRQVQPAAVRTVRWKVPPTCSMTTFEPLTL